VGSDAAFRVALTFDAEHPDRPARPGNDERLLDALAAAGVRGTFFVQGRWAEAFPSVARRIAVDGHLVGSHTFYHARLPLFSEWGLANDLQAAEEVIQGIVGVDPRPWIRAPFGTGANDVSLIWRLEALGYRHIGWHVSPEDWDPATSRDEVEQAVVEGVAANGDGSVALMHTWPDPTHAALPAIIDRLRGAGAAFVTVAELDDPPAGVPFGEDE
jgi:peptidoglycan/xylan/chitin deacetylase (PgdA/CDA1 family)